MNRGGYLWHLILSMGTRLTTIVVRLLRNVLLARILGPADRGLFALLSALPDLVAALTSGGLNTAVGYNAARGVPIGVLLTQILVYGCLLAGATTLAGVALLRGFGGALAFVDQLGPLLWLLLLAVPLTVLKSGLLTLHNADERIGPFNALRLLESLAPLVLFVALWLLLPRDQMLIAALASWLLGLAAVVVAGWRWLARFHDLQPQWNKTIQRALLCFGAKSHPDTICQQFMRRADYLLIGAMLPAAALGHYAMATVAAELLLIVPEAVTTPLMKRLLRQGEGIQDLTALALRLTATAMLVACVVTALIGEWLIVVLFGAPYAPAYPALLALLPGVFGLCYASILRLDLLGKELPGSLSLLMGMATAVDVALVLWLIPKWGIVGAGIASSVAYLFVTVGMLEMYCRSGGALWRSLILLPGDVAAVAAMLRGKRGQT
ncbi:MAG: oligosaccharide flippase family protein [Azoarcus sp.]|jgi:O-antigen/teichoic acid export membrane protein|nr:oligosaccharide flippase family protein [Azoarcus sp.]